MDASDEKLFASFTEYRAEVLAALGNARRTVAIFDPDLRDCRLESRDGVRLLEELCMRSTGRATLRILLHGTAWLERECPRLIALLARYGHCTEVRTTDRGARSWSQPFLIVDGERLVTRFHTDLPRGKTASFETPSAALLATQFETFWSNAVAASPGTPLGI